MSKLLDYLRSAFAPAPPRPSVPTLAEVRARGAEQLAARRLAEDVVPWDGYVSPLDRYMDGTRLLAPVLPFGGRQARRGGRDQPTFTTEPELLSYRELSRALYRWNDYAGGLIDVLVAYTCLKGLGWQACRRGPKKGADAGAGGDTPPDVAAAQWCFDEFRDRARWRSREQELVRRWHRDGEAFVRLFRGRPGCPPQCRFVEPEYVLAPAAEMDVDNPCSFGVLTREGDVEGVLGFWVTDPRNVADGEAVRAAGTDEGEFLALCEAKGLPVGPGVMLHFKANTDMTVKRGLPTLLASRDGLELARKTVRDVGNTADFQAKIGLIRRHAGATPSTLTDFQAAFTGGATVRTPGLLSGGGSATFRDVPAYMDPAGTKIVDSTDQTDYEAGPVSGGVPNFLEAVQATLRAAAVRTQTPEHVISGDADSANFAAIKESGSPFVVARESDQMALADFERDVAREVIRLGCESGCPAGIDPAALDAEIVVPPVAMKSDLETAQVESIRIHDGTLSPQEAIRHRGADPKHVAADLAGWKRLNPPPEPTPGGDDGGEYGLDSMGRKYKRHRGDPPADPNGPPPTAAEGRVREVKDGSGHQHKGKGPGGGQFTSQGGGGGGKEKDGAKTGPPSEPWQERRADFVARRPEIPQPGKDVDLEEIASELRDSVAGVAGGPKDMCIAAAHAIRRAYPDAEIWDGLYNGEPHVLAKLGGKFIDVTADQFDASPEIQVLDPDDLPREYRRYERSDEYENGKSAANWPNAKEVAADFRERLTGLAENEWERRHIYAVHSATKAGKPVSAEVLADYPALAHKDA